MGERVKTALMNDSLKKRYFYKLFSNFLGIPISIAVQSIIPRGLGPKNYGDFNFLSNFFTQIVSFFDAGTSIGFYTKLSQRPKESKLVSFYFYFIFVVTLLVVAFVTIVCSAGIHVKLWPDQLVFYIYLAVFFSVLTWITQVMGQITDACGLTVPAEVGKVFQKIIGLLIIVILFLNQKLNLTNFFFYNYIILFLLILILIRVTRRYTYSLQGAWKLDSAETKGYVKEFYQYSHPLIVYSFVGLVAGIFDRWLLQIYGGSVQQGFFGLSYQIGAICFLFAGTMTLLITREFSIAYNNKDLELIANLFHKYIPLLYSITAFFACFIAANANKVTFIIGGGRFRDATLAVAIMAFFPIHQTYGQLSGSLFYATGQTKLYRNIGIVFMLVGLPFTYFMIAPNKLFGMNAGASGLAIKMVLLQFIAVNVQLYFNVRLLKLSFVKYFLHQLLSIAFFVVCAFIPALFINKFLPNLKGIIPQLMFSGIVYVGITMILAFFVPSIFGLKKEDLKEFFSSLFSRLAGKYKFIYKEKKKGKI
jgi:O-antigen/teichoic acid export membrane protein